MSHSTVIDFPRRRPVPALPDYRLPSAAYASLAQAAMLVDDLACRIAELGGANAAARRRLARRAEAIADGLILALEHAQVLP